MEIRELTASDLFKLSSIAEKITMDLAESLAADLNEKQLGIHVAFMLLRHVPHEIKDFLADVTNQKPEELEKKPFHEPIKIIRSLYARQEFKDFLQEINFLKSEISKK